MKNVLFVFSFCWVNFMFALSFSFLTKSLKEIAAQVAMVQKTLDNKAVFPGNPFPRDDCEQKSTEKPGKPGLPAQENEGGNSGATFFRGGNSGDYFG